MNYFISGPLFQVFEEMLRQLHSFSVWSHGFGTTTCAVQIVVLFSKLVPQVELLSISRACETQEGHRIEIQKHLHVRIIFTSIS